MKALKKFYDPSLGVVQTSRGEMKMAAVFLPLFLETFLMNFMNTVNTWILSYYSDEAVAAVGTASQFISMVLTLFSVVSTGTSIYIGQKIGAREDEEASDAAFSSIVFITLFSFVVCTVLSLSATPLMIWMNLTGNALDYAVTYFRIVIQFCFFSGIISVLGAVFRSYGRPQLSVITNLFANIVNALLNCLVIFRPFSFFPLEGVAGIAWSRVISMAVATVLIICMFYMFPVGIRFKNKSVHSMHCLLQVLRVGIPSGVSSLAYSASQVVTTAIIATLGVTAVSTKVYVSNVVFYVYMIGMALGMSTSLMISWMCGAGEYERAYRLNLQNLRVTILLNAVLSSLLFLFGYPVLGIFTDDPLILSSGRMLLLIDIFVEIFRGFNHIEENSLRGSGDVMFPMIVATISCWLMSVLVGYILGIRLGLGIYGIWIAFGLDEMFRGVNYLLRWRSGKWKEMTLK